MTGVNAVPNDYCQCPMCRGKHSHKFSETWEAATRETFYVPRHRAENAGAVT